MATVSETITAAQATAFDALKNAFFGSDTTVTLLKQDTTADAFTTIATVDDSWWFEEDQTAQKMGTRNRYLLEIAKDANDTAFTTDITAATHVQINSDVYVIQAADTTPPLGTSTTWKVYLEVSACCFFAIKVQRWGRVDTANPPPQPLGGGLSEQD